MVSGNITLGHLWQRFAAGRGGTGVLGLVLLLGLWAGFARADVTCDASVNRTSVPSGGEVELTVSAQGDVNWNPEFTLPDLPSVQIYAGGTNQSMSMINGRTETSVSRTYYLKVEGSSDFTIGPVLVTAGRESCETEPITIRVTAAGSRNQQVPPVNSGNRTTRPNTVPSGVSGGNGSGGKPGDDVFVTLTADQTEAWVGQQIVVTFSYWWRSQSWNSPNYTPPRTEGFWREPLGSEKRTRKVVQGRAYNVTEIRYAVFPTRAGDLVIEPAELSFPRGVFESFFETSRTRRRPRSLRTDPVKIHVRELPQPAPAGFSGIVASRLLLTSQADRDSVPRGEALGLKVVLTADGFLKGFSDLKVSAPAHTRLHDAGENFQTEIQRDRLVGQLTVEKVIVPEQDGALQLPPVNLVWFDSDAEEYRTASTGPLAVQVTPSDLPTVGADDSGFLRNELSRLGDDLAFIHPVPASLSRRWSPFVGSGVWWLLLMMPLVLLAGWRVLLVRWAAELRDPAGRRRRGALAAARACLAQSDDPAGTAVARAICGYVADCTDQPLPAIGPTEVGAYCRELGLPEVGEQLTSILATCDAARYGQTGGEAPAQVAAEVGDYLARLDRQGRAGQKSGKRGRTAGSLAVLLFLTGSVLLVQAAPSLADDSATPGMGADPVRLVAEGNQAYTAGQLPEAVEKYEAARDLGVNDAVLHFNLGNAYARQGQLGKAVVCYLRAQRLAPRDKDNRANLAWVRRHIRDLELSENSLPLFIAQVVSVVGWLTLAQWGWILVMLSWLVAAIVAWGWYRGYFAPGLRRLLLGGVALLLFVAVITTSRWYSEMVRDSAVVVVPSVVVRSGPADTFSALFEIHDGLTLNIEEHRNGWARVGLGGDWEGWVPATSVEAVRQADLFQGR